MPARHFLLLPQFSSTCLRSVAAPGVIKDFFVIEPKSLSQPTSVSGAIPDSDEKAERISLQLRVTNILAITVPLLGLAAAGLLMWGWGFYWVELGLLVGMNLLTVLGVTV